MRRSMRARGRGPEAGSSRMSRSGSCTRARASDSRCFMPRDRALTSASRLDRGRPARAARRAGPATGGGDPVGAGEELEVLLDRGVVVDAEHVGHVADLPADGRRSVAGVGVAGHPDHAGGRLRAARRAPPSSWSCRRRSGRSGRRWRLGARRGRGRGTANSEPYRLVRPRTDTIGSPPGAPASGPGLGAGVGLPGSVTSRSPPGASCRGRCRRRRRPEVGGRTRTTGLPAVRRRAPRPCGTVTGRGWRPRALVEVSTRCRPRRRSGDVGGHGEVRGHCAGAPGTSNCHTMPSTRPPRSASAPRRPRAPGPPRGGRRPGQRAGRRRLARADDRRPARRRRRRRCRRLVELAGPADRR